ncbi:hypothetical protein AIOL_001803 [Candidatus Rhodobacter oscarellae]|uniref:Uncharacterized protein n=1 Tax=Candidatus Rhodobacter oscarellae TaxID=1675527 RepID=A0A0J9E1R8_9RHOB|nr:hypothetical protein [Candidatus Rhodobacter lobularis]KMW56846.1 hypothetical protein AIOL_001803 [Candidatus Rhodobacter lobularis]
MFDEIDNHLNARGFRLAVLGLDGVQGNALYIKQPRLGADGD